MYGQFNGKNSLTYREQTSLIWSI